MSVITNYLLNVGEPRAGLGFINCDDEEDCIQGSGSGDYTGTGGPLYTGSHSSPGYSNNNMGNNPSGTNEEFYARGTDSKSALKKERIPFA